MNDTGSLAAVVAEASTVSKPTTTPESTWVLAFCGPEASRDHHCNHLNELLGELARRARCRPGAGLLVPKSWSLCPGTGALCPGAGALCRDTGILAPGRSIPAPGRPKPVPGRRSRRPRAVTGPGAQGLRRDPAYGLRLRVPRSRDFLLQVQAMYGVLHGQITAVSHPATAVCVCICATHACITVHAAPHTPHATSLWVSEAAHTDCSTHIIL